MMELSRIVPADLDDFIFQKITSSAGAFAPSCLHVGPYRGTYRVT